MTSACRKRIIMRHRRSLAMQAARRWLLHAYWGAFVISGVSFVGTLLDPQWIERWFGESPDGGDGNAERWVVGGCFLLLAVLAALLARREHRRGVLTQAS
jgi:hypothetical protein